MKEAVDAVSEVKAVAGCAVIVGDRIAFNGTLPQDGPCQWDILPHVPHTVPRRKGVT